MKVIARRLHGRMHYGWIVAAVIFFVLLAAAGVRATPSVLIVPLEQAFGWTRATISLAIGVNIFLYGLMGPFAAAVMQRFGIRRTVVGRPGRDGRRRRREHDHDAQPWQLMLTWGLLDRARQRHGRAGARRHHRQPLVRQRGAAWSWASSPPAPPPGQLVFLPMLAAVVAEFRLAARGLDHGLRRRGDGAAGVPASCANGRRMWACAAYGADAGTPPRGRRRPATRSSSPCRTRRGLELARLLAAVPQLLRLRPHHQRADRHPSDRRLLRPGHPGSPRRRPAGGDGHLRPDRHHRRRAGCPTATTAASCCSGTTGCAACR